MGWEFKFYTDKDKDYQEKYKDKVPKPHRCDDRVIDFCRCVVAWDTMENVKSTWRVLWDCVVSEPGQEPKDPYIWVTPRDAVFKRTPQPEKQPESQQPEEQQRKAWWGR